MKRLYFIFPITVLFLSCQEEYSRADAYGNFETATTTISAQATGQLVKLKVQEGEHLAAGLTVGLIDTTLLHLQRQQIKSQIQALPQKLSNSLAEIDVLRNQKKNLTREVDRVENLLKERAATPQQLDDLVGKIEVLEKQMEAIRSQTSTKNRAILAEKEPLLAHIDLIEEQIARCYISNPINGTVLTKLTEPHEFVNTGSPLYRLAPLDTLSLRFYVDAVQLQELSLGQLISVWIDEGSDNHREMEGEITWISDEAEFTPKTIQTKEDRVNLVYAIKARVPNPQGRLKIGMPAEVYFQDRERKSNS